MGQSDLQIIVCFRYSHRLSLFRFGFDTSWQQLVDPGCARLLVVG